MKLELIRDTFTDYNTLGTLLADGAKIGETLEDTDRKLEDGGEKVYGKTAIPRGTYKISITFSNRFQKPMPLIHDVPGFDGVRIHGGNTDADTLGCPLLGSIRTDNGIAKCAGPNARLIALLEQAEDIGEECTIEVK